LQGKLTAEFTREKPFLFLRLCGETFCSQKIPPPCPFPKNFNVSFVPFQNGRQNKKTETREKRAFGLFLGLIPLFFNGRNKRPPLFFIGYSLFRRYCDILALRRL
jgi:hypothetical protein